MFRLRLESSDNDPRLLSEIDRSAHAERFLFTGSTIFGSQQEHKDQGRKSQRNQI